MKVWKRVAGAIKDQNSLLAASLAQRTSVRNPNLEAAIIRATSHNEFCIDYKNTQRVYKWIRTSPLNLKPLIRSLAARVDRTRSWVVALKSLILMHGVFCCKIASTDRLRPLPFNLSDFCDAHSNPYKMWGFNSFVRAYFAFLDKKAHLMSDFAGKQREESLLQELAKLEKLQSLLDLLVQVKPTADNMKTPLILEAMDCVIIEIFDVYSKICNGIARVLTKIYPSAGKMEAATALKVVKKATRQGEELSMYFEFCREFGVINANGFPNRFVTKVPEEDIRALERIKLGVPTEDFEEEEVEKSIIVIESAKEGMQTIITEEWEIFDDEFDVKEKWNDHKSPPPLLLTLPPLISFDDDDVDTTYQIPDSIRPSRYEIPDLISF